MKKLLLLALIAMMMVGCERKPRTLNQYEVLLLNGRTLHIEAYFYEVSIGTFSSRKTYEFYDTCYNKIITIDNSIYVKKLNKQ